MANVIVTEAANRVPSFDFSSFDFTRAAVLVASNAEIVLGRAPYVLRFQGDFTYDQVGNVARQSTIDGFELFYEDSLLIQAVGVSLTSEQIATNTFGSLLAVALSGDDTYISHINSGERIITFAGDDNIQAGTGDDVIYGGLGTDSFIVSPKVPGYSFVFDDVAGATLTTSSGADRLFDVESIQVGSQILNVQEGSNVDDILKSAVTAFHNTRDMIHGRGGDDFITGGSGQDYLLGGLGDDQISGEAHHDLIAGGLGDDVLYGQTGRDRLHGDSGNDTIFGGVDDDTLFGGDGDDRLIGQAGDDRLTGGRHADTFVFASGDGNDTITDFRIGEDVIEIGRDVHDFGDLGFAAVGGDVRVTFSNGSVLVEGVGLTALMQRGNFHLTSVPSPHTGGVSLLSEDETSAIAELYIAYFGRAPDANGLNYWADQFASGMSLARIASNFSNSTEYRSVFGDGPDTHTFVATAYQNVLGRHPDAPGAIFWRSLLEAGGLSKEEFILQLLGGVKPASADRIYLDQKLDIGVYYSIIKGLSDLADASRAMALYDGSEGSVHEVVQFIDSVSSDTLDVTPIVGVFENPFASFAF